MRVLITKDVLMKALEDFDTSGNRWIKGHYLWPDEIECDATSVEEKKEENKWRKREVAKNKMESVWKILEEWYENNPAKEVSVISNPPPLPKQKIRTIDRWIVDDKSQKITADAIRQEQLRSKLNEMIDFINSSL